VSKSHPAVHGAGAVARQVGLTLQRLQYLISKKRLPGPSFSIPGRHLFTNADVQRILQALRADLTLAARSEAEAGSCEDSRAL
jgi:hypothetical protein